MLPISAYCDVKNTKEDEAKGCFVNRLTTEYIHPKHIDAESLQKLIQKNNMLSDKGRIVLDKRTNTLIIQDENSRVKIVKELVKVRDKPLCIKEEKKFDTFEYQTYHQLNTEYLRLKYIKADEVSHFIQNNNMLSDKGSSNFDWRTNTLIITDTQTVAKTIKQKKNKLYFPY